MLKSDIQLAVGALALILGIVAIPARAVSPSVERVDYSLRMDAKVGETQALEALLKEGADPNGAGLYGETALMYAAKYNQVRAADLLISKRAEVNAQDAQGNTALINAATSCSSTIITKLLAAHADPNIANHAGRTPLMEAVAAGCVPAVNQLLTSKKVELNSIDYSGRTALDLALDGAEPEVGAPYSTIVKSLHSAGARSGAITLTTQQ